MAESPEALVLTGYGINTDYETLEACRLAGFSASRVHLNDVIAGAGILFRQKLVVFPGGFSFGDDLGSGVAFAAKVRYAGQGEGGRLYDLFAEYVLKGGLVLGICNGFQILVRMGLVPALGGRYGRQEVTLAPNREGYFIDRWVRLRVEKDSPCVFTVGMETLELPVRHGEGRFLPKDGDAMALIEEGRRVALRYCDARGEPTMEFPPNPNGSAGAVAGICDGTGRVFGLMPHPEAATSLFQRPDWTRRREEGRRKVARRGKDPAPERAGQMPAGHLPAGRTMEPPCGDGLGIFRNAREYVR